MAGDAHASGSRLNDHADISNQPRYSKPRGASKGKIGPPPNGGGREAAKNLVWDVAGFARIQLGG